MDVEMTGYHCTMMADQYCRVFDVLCVPPGLHEVLLRRVIRPQRLITHTTSRAFELVLIHGISPSEVVRLAHQQGRLQRIQRLLGGAGRTR